MVTILILYTTRYREGGRSFTRVARTLQAERRQATGLPVHCVATDSKRAVRKELARLRAAGDSLAELHFVGHSGMYGPMFGTQQWPEQFSRHEWRNLAIPFATQAAAYFHACRTARWFAPFFADTFNVPAHGYHWYTTFSRRKDRFVWAPPVRSSEQTLYVFGCPGKKSHGLLGSVKKYGGLTAPEPFHRFDPVANRQRGYEAVADLYAETFSDFRVRRDEWRFIHEQLPLLAGQPLRCLDLGCGNGALLAAIAPHLQFGLGVDPCAELIHHAQRRGADFPQLRFERLQSPRLPVEDQSLDLVLSVLSFRYLDWDPTLAEIRRVLKPRGRLWVIDMVASPAGIHQLPRALFNHLRDRLYQRYRPDYGQALQAMVRDPRWQEMLRYNPIRADHEFRWYLQSRFPAGSMTLLNQSRRARILAFDSGPMWAAPTPTAYGADNELSAVTAKTSISSDTRAPNRVGWP